MIFVSHKESDAKVAKALVEFLRSSLDVPTAKIRCTSVPGYQLPFGRTIAAQLKGDIDVSSAVFVLITPASLQSRWVLFELGASWALGKVIIPIMASGLQVDDLPGPLAEYPVVRIDDVNAAARLRDAISQVAQSLRLTEKGGGEAQSALESFVQALRDWAPIPPPDTARARAFQLSWLILYLFTKQARHPVFIQSEIEAHAVALGLELPSTWRRGLAEDDGSGRAFQELLENLGGQLVSRHPRLVSHFEAGWNLLFTGQSADKDTLRAMLSKLDLPNELIEPQADRLYWMSRVHEYFVRVLRSSND